MASDIYSMLTGSYDPAEESRKQQQAFRQQLGTATDPRAFIAAVGSNMGGQLGQGAQRLFGAPSQKEVQAQAMQEAFQVANQNPNATPAEKMKLVAQYLSGKPGMESQAMMAVAEARRLEAEDITLAQAREKGEMRKVSKRITTKDLAGNDVIKSIEVTEYKQPDGSWSETPPARALPPTGAGAGRGFVNPPMGGATTSPAPAPRIRGTVEITPQTQGEIKSLRTQQEEARKAQDEMNRILGISTPSGGGLTGAEPEALPADERKMEFNPELDRQRQQLQKLLKLKERLGSNAPPQLDAAIETLRKKTK